MANLKDLIVNGDARVVGNEYVNGELNVLGDIKKNGTKVSLEGHTHNYAASSHNQASNTINAMTGYSKASSAAAITTSDTLNTAIGKLEKTLDSAVKKVNNVSPDANGNVTVTTDDGAIANTSINNLFSGESNLEEVLQTSDNYYTKTEVNNKILSSQIPSKVQARSLRYEDYIFYASDFPMDNVKYILNTNYDILSRVRYISNPNLIPDDIWEEQQYYIERDNEPIAHYVNELYILNQKIYGKCVDEDGNVVVLNATNGVIVADKNLDFDDDVKFSPSLNNEDMNKLITLGDVIRLLGLDQVRRIDGSGPT